MEFVWIPILLVFVVVLLMQSIKVIRQQSVGIVERLGKFKRVLEPGPHLVVPLVDKVRYNLDMREAVRPFPPQGVITEDNLMVNIDSVIYFQIVDPVRAAYEAQNYEAAIEQLTMTTLRNIIGGLDLEETLTSREEINQKLRAVLDEATGKWGIKVNRVELRAIEPPPTIRDAMEKGARAERDKRAAILLAEGQRQSQVLGAAGEKESAVLRAQGEREAMILRAQADRQSKMLRAEGEAQAITTVFEAIHAGQPDQGLLAYQYMQMLPTLARGDSNKVWIVPSELNDALKGLGSTVGQIAQGIAPQATGTFTKPDKIDVFAEIAAQKGEADAKADEVVKAAVEEAQALENPALARRREDEPPALAATTDEAAEVTRRVGSTSAAAVGPAAQPGANPWQSQGSNPYGPQATNPYAAPAEGPGQQPAPGQ